MQPVASTEHSFCYSINYSFAYRIRWQLSENSTFNIFKYARYLYAIFNDIYDFALKLKMWQFDDDDVSSFPPWGDCHCGCGRDIFHFLFQTICGAIFKYVIWIDKISSFTNTNDANLISKLYLNVALEMSKNHLSANATFEWSLNINFDNRIWIYVIYIYAFKLTCLERILQILPISLGDVNCSSIN